MSDRRRMAFEILIVAAALGAGAGALITSSEPGESAYDGGLLVMYLGMALAVLSALPVRQLRWRLIPYLLAAALCWLVAWYAGVALVDLT
jgi:hypothetical protein